MTSWNDLANDPSARVLRARPRTAFLLLLAAASSAACSEELPSLALPERLSVAVFTSGEAHDADGYSLYADGEVVLAHVPPKDTVIHLDDFEPESASSFTLGGVAENCQVATQLGVSGAAVPDVRFDVTCAMPAALATKVIVFLRDGDAHRMALDGSPPARLTTRGDVASVVPSPDGSRLALATSAGLLVVDADGAGPTSVTGSGETRSPSWSPDGARIAYVDAAAGALRIVTLETGEVLSPAAAAEEVVAAAWSPDGTRIAFLIAPDGAPSLRELHLIDPDGGNAQLLEPIPSGTVWWSPTSDRLAFAAEHRVEAYAIADGRREELIAWAPDASLSPVVSDWSEDGRWILLSGSVPYVFLSRDVFVADLEGGSILRLTHDLLSSGAKLLVD